MKRLLATLLLAVVATLGLAACGGDDAAVSVNGDVVLTQDEADELLEEFAASEDLLTSVDGRGAGNETLRSGYVSTVMIGNAVLERLLAEEIERQGLEVTDERVEQGRAILESNLANPQDGSTPLTLDQLPDTYRALLEDLYANFTTLLADLGGNPTDPADPANVAAQDELSARLQELRLDADVDIDPRLGRWVVADGVASVEPAEGPIAPTTTALPTD